MNYKIIYLIIGFIFYSCVQDLSLTSNEYSVDLSDEDIQWFYDSDSQDLLVQIDVNNIGQGNVNHIYVKDISNPSGDYYEIFDNGENGDLIGSNGIYSMLFSDIIVSNYTLDIRVDIEGNDIVQELQHQINFNPPSIIEDITYPVIPLEHILDEDDITYFNMVLAIDDQDGQSDIEFVNFYIKKVSFFDGALIDGSCDYTFVEQDEYAWDPTWQMDYIGINTNEQFVYNSQIPMNPIQSSSSCGGFGYVQFKFEVQDSKGFSDVLEIEEIIQICPGICE